MLTAPLPTGPPTPMPVFFPLAPLMNAWPRPSTQRTEQGEREGGESGVGKAMQHYGCRAAARDREARQAWAASSLLTATRLHLQRRGSGTKEHKQGVARRFLARPGRGALFLARINSIFYLADSACVTGRNTHSGAVQTSAHLRIFVCRTPRVGLTGGG